MKDQLLFMHAISNRSDSEFAQITYEIVKHTVKKIRQEKFNADLSVHQSILDLAINLFKNEPIALARPILNEIKSLEPSLFQKLKFTAYPLIFVTTTTAATVLLTKNASFGFTLGMSLTVPSVFYATHGQYNNNIKAQLSKTAFNTLKALGEKETQDNCLFLFETF